MVIHLDSEKESAAAPPGQKSAALRQHHRRSTANKTLPLETAELAISTWRVVLGFSSSEYGHLFSRHWLQRQNDDDSYIHRIDTD
jgi:hypothetical protein